MWTYQVPNDLFDKLLSGFVADTAQSVLELRDTGSVLHPGDSYGQVLAWLWKAEPSTAVACVADLLAQVRYHARGSDKSITLDERRRGVRFATHAMPSARAEALMSRLRADVPGYFDADVTSQPGAG